MGLIFHPVEYLVVGLAFLGKMAWKYKTGLGLIGAVVFIWVASAEITQVVGFNLVFSFRCLIRHILFVWEGKRETFIKIILYQLIIEISASISYFLQNIFEKYKQPFALTYLGVSLMVVYLPIAFIKDWFCSLFHTYLFKGVYSGSSVSSSSTGLDIPLTINDVYQGPETEACCCLVTDREEGWPVIVKNGDEEPPLLERSCKISSWEVAKCSLCLAPIWFLTEVI